jgi:hypothetical protein
VVLFGWFASPRLENQDEEDDDKDEREKSATDAHIVRLLSFGLDAGFSLAAGYKAEQAD